MKYVVRNGLIVNKWKPEGIYPASTIIEIEQDLGNLYNKYNLSKFRYIYGEVVERTDEDIFGSADYLNLMQNKRKEQYRKESDDLAHELFYMEKKNDLGEKYNLKLQQYFAIMEQIKELNPIGE